MTAAGDEEARRAGRARAVALFRYALIREAADPALSTRQRGRLVRELAAGEHAGPFGEPVRVSRRQPGPVDPGVAGRRVRRAGAGRREVAPGPRPRCSTWPRRSSGKHPDRTAAQVARILRGRVGGGRRERTLQRYFVRLELTPA